MIQVSGLCKTYSGSVRAVQVLRNVSMQLHQGEFLALMGNSGAGKSTLLNLLGCLDTPSSGSYQLAGQEISGLAPGELAKVRNAEIGFVFQSSHFVEYLDLADNVALPNAYSQNSTEQDARARATILLQKVGLGERTDHRPSMLSGGERQRAAIARALFNQPSLLLADEPTGNLDQDNAGRIMEIFRDLNQQGLSILMVTHDPRIAATAGLQAHLADGELRMSAAV